MSLVYAGVLSHAPGITGRAHLVENTAKRDEFYARLDQQRQEIEDAGAEVLIVIAAEHFANFFMKLSTQACNDWQPTTSISTRSTAGIR